LIRWLRKEIQTLKKCEAHEAKGEAERFIDFIQRRTGLLNEQGRDRYAFVHKTFQEYLTAEEIFDRADVEDDTEIILAHFRQHLHNQHWREVLLLLVSKLKGKKAQKAIQTVLDAGNEYEQWLHRDLLFAGWCLTEDPPELTLVAGDLVGEIIDRLVGLEVGASDQIGSKIKSEVEKILHCFGETTLAMDVWKKLEEQKDLIRSVRWYVFQITLGREVERIDSLLSLLGSGDRDLQSFAIIFLGEIGNASQKVASGLLSLLNHEDTSNDSNLEFKVIKALGRLGNTSLEVVNCLVSLLTHEESVIASHAAEVLVQLGHDTRNEIDALLHLLKNENSNVRFSAVAVLAKLYHGHANPQVISGLLSLLSDEDIRFYSISMLEEIGNDNPNVIDGLEFLLGDKSQNVRLRAATALCHLGNTASATVNCLISLLTDENSCLRSSVVQTLGILVDTSSAVVDVLRSLLNDENSNVRFSAARVLSKAGDTSPAVVDVLRFSLDDENSNVRFSAARALSKAGDTSSAVVDVFLSFLGHKGIYIGVRASESLFQMSKTSDKILPEVVQWLEQNLNDDEIGSAIDCLWSIVVK
jgi:HEAT repeat protein